MVFGVNFYSTFEDGFKVTFSKKSSDLQLFLSTFLLPALPLFQYIFPKWQPTTVTPGSPVSWWWWARDRNNVTSVCILQNAHSPPGQALIPLNRISKIFLSKGLNECSTYPPHPSLTYSYLFPSPPTGQPIRPPPCLPIVRAHFTQASPDCKPASSPPHPQQTVLQGGPHSWCPKLLILAILLPLGPSARVLLPLSLLPFQ